MFRKFVKISEISKYLDISGKCVSIKSGVEEKITVNSLLSGENSLKQLLLTNNQLVTRLIKFFD